MEPTSFLLGVLFTSVKGLGIGAIGFGIAWWRGQVRIRQLEDAQRPDPAALEERLGRLEGNLEYVASALERLATGQDDLRKGLALPASRDAIGRLPQTGGRE